MSKTRIGFIPFARFEPDLPEFDNPSLEEARNVVPAYGSYRPLEKLAQLSEGTVVDALVGGYAHLTTKDDPKYRMVPDAVGAQAGGRWYDKDLVQADDSNDWFLENINSYRPDDTTFIRSNTMQPTSPAPLTRLYYTLKAPKETPTSATFADYVIKVRVRSWWPSWWINPLVEFGLYDKASDTEVCISTQQLANSSVEAGPNPVEELEYALANAPELAAITDWDQVEFFFNALQGFAEVRPAGVHYDSLLGDLQFFGWLSNDGDFGNIYEYCRYRGHDAGWDPPEDAARDAWETDWVISPDIYGGEENTPYIAQFGYNVLKDPEREGVIFLSAHLGATDPGVTCNMQLLQLAESDAPDGPAADYVVHGENRFTIIAEATHEVPVVNDVNNMDTLQDGEERILTLSKEEVASIDEDKRLYASFVPAFGGGGTGTIELEPTNKVSGANWTGAIATIQNDDSDYMKHNSGSNNKLQVQVDAGPVPDTTGAVKIKVKLKSTDGANSAQVHMLESSGGGYIPIGQGSFDFNNTESTKTVSIAKQGNGTTSAGWGAVTDWSKIEIKITTKKAWINRFWVEYPGEDAAKMVIDYVHGPESRSYAAAVSLHQAYFEVPPPRDYKAGDRVEIFTGDSNKLYRVSGEGFEDLTPVAGDYGQSAVDTPKTWDFCSWGDWVIASNYTDPVQYYDLGLGTGEFDDLITTHPGAQAPIGRFVAVVAGQLHLADINPNSYAAGEKYHIWPSAVLDPQSFYEADYNSQSSLFSLVASPGQITGYVGGEYGLLFKRNSVWRVSYEGLPGVLGFDQLSRGEGTPYPSSIVQVDNDTFFWGSNGIFAIRDGKKIERVSGQRIEKFLYDVQYEDRALYRVEDEDVRVTDAMVQGAYDRGSGLIWWSYRQKTDDAFHNSMMLVYNPREDKFSFIEGVDTSVLVGLSSAMSDARFLNEGLANIRWDGATTGHLETFTGSTGTYAGSMMTKILSAGAIAKAPGRDLAIQAVRPVYKANPDGVQPNFEIEIIGAQDPSLQINRVERTVDRTHEDLDGWISTSIPVAGEFYRFQLTVPSLYQSTVKEILGIGIKYTYAGTY